MESYKLGKIVKVFNGKTPKKSEHKKKGFPVLKIKDFSNAGFFLGTYGTYIENSVAQNNIGRVLQEGDIIVLNSAHHTDYVASKIGFITDENAGALPVGEWTIFRTTSKEINNKYLYYYIKSQKFKNFLRKITKGGHLYPTDIRKYTIQLPKIKDQIEIANKLTIASNMLKKRKDLILNNNILLNNLFLKIFGNPFNIKSSSKVKISEIIRQDKIKFNKKKNKLIRYLSLRDIEANSGKIKESNNKNEISVKSGTYKFNESHILYGKLRPYLNKVATPNFNGHCSTELVPYLIINPRFTKEYLVSFLRSNLFVNIANESSRGARMPRTNLRYIENLRIKIPDKKKLDLFSNCYNKILNIDHLYQKSQKLLFLLEFNLLNNYLS